MDTLKVMDVLHARTSPNQEGLRFEGHYRFDDLQTEGDAICAWRIRPEGVGLSIKGHLTARVEMECVRCLARYTVPMDLEIDEKYVFDDYIDHSERERELTSEDFFEVIDQQGELDLKDLVHQLLILESASHETCGGEHCHYQAAQAGNY